MKKLRITKIEKSKFYSGLGVVKVAGIRLFKFKNRNGELKCEQLRKVDGAPIDYTNERMYRNGKRTIRLMAASTYEYSQNYGGSEEGGWYYTTRVLLGSFKALCYRSRYSCWKLVDKRKERLLNANTGKYGKYDYEGYSQWNIEAVAGQNEYTERPHYE